MQDTCQAANQQFTSERFTQKLKQKQMVTHLKLHLNYSDSLIRDIVQNSISLSKLIFLNLGYNNIISLEPFQQMSLPYLQQLHLFHNQLTSLRSLRKCSIPKLKFASFVGNHLLAMNGIQEWNCPEVYQLVGYDNQIYEIKGLLRTNFNKLRSLCMGEDIDDKESVQKILFYRFSCYQL